jgi:hypothetical protein
MTEYRTWHREEDVTWRFTVKNGTVKKIGPVETAKEKYLRTDEDGKPFLHLPMPHPEMIAEIEQSVRDQFGEGVSGKGIFDEGDQMLDFEPEKQS